MSETKLTVRVPREVILMAKRYARANDTTLTRLVTEFLRHLGNTADPVPDARVVRRLSGILPREVPLEDYHKHLLAKYGDQT